MEPSYAFATLPLVAAPWCLLIVGLVLYMMRRREGAAWVYAAALGMIATVAPIIAAAPAVLGGVSVLDRSPIRLARLGSADLVLGFQLDRPALVVACAVLCLVVAGLVRAALRRAGEPPSASAHEVFFLGAFALAAALSDGFAGATLFVGLAALGASLRDRSPASAARLGAVAMVPLGAALLFWSLGGQWLDDRAYYGDFRARFAVANPEAERGELLKDARASGSLTFVSHPGAEVYLGVATEAQLARSTPFAIAPFVRMPIPIGLQKIVIVPGEGATVAGEGVEAALVDTVNVRAGEETIVSVSGPTLTFHEVAAQVDEEGAFLRADAEPIAVAVGVPKVAQPKPAVLPKVALPSRRIGSSRVGELAALLVGVAAVLASLGVGRDAFGGPLTQVVTLGVVARLTPMVREGTATYVALGALALALAFAIFKRSPIAAASAVAAGCLLLGQPVLGFVAMTLVACVVVGVSTRQVIAARAPAPPSKEQAVSDEPSSSESDDDEPPEEDVEEPAREVVAARATPAAATTAKHGKKRSKKRGKSS